MTEEREHTHSHPYEKMRQDYKAGKHTPSHTIPLDKALEPDTATLEGRVEAKLNEPGNEMMSPQTAISQLEPHIKALPEQQSRLSLLDKVRNRLKLLREGTR